MYCTRWFWWICDSSESGDSGEWIVNLVFLVNLVILSILVNQVILVNKVIRANLENLVNPHRMVCMVEAINSADLKWRCYLWGTDDKQRKTGQLSLWTVGRLSFTNTFKIINGTKKLRNSFFMVGFQENSDTHIYAEMKISIFMLMLLAVTCQKIDDCQAAFKLDSNFGLKLVFGDKSCFWFQSTIMIWNLWVF